jgi:hypothetical protein
MWSKFPLKGSKEYRALVTLTGLLVGAVWIARDEMENPKWTAIPKASELSVDDLSSWNKEFGPKDLNKWAIPAQENEKILKSLSPTKSETSEASHVQKKETW